MVVKDVAASRGREREHQERAGHAAPACHADARRVRPALTRSTLARRRKTHATSGVTRSVRYPDPLGRLAPTGISEAADPALALDRHFPDERAKPVASTNRPTFPGWMGRSSPSGRSIVGLGPSGKRFLARCDRIRVGRLPTRRTTVAPAPASMEAGAFLDHHTSTIMLTTRTRAQYSLRMRTIWMVTLACFALGTTAD